MIIYSSTKKDFIQDFEKGILVKKLHQTLTEQHRRSGQAEIQSWQNSLSYMANVMRDISIPEMAGVAIEYIIPNTQKRVDFIITGEDFLSKENVIVVELKQWSEASKVEGLENIVSTYVGKGRRNLTHPSYQAWSYCSLIENFNEDVQNRPITLHPCSFLHNYDETISPELRDPIYTDILSKAPMFTLGQMEELRNFIKQYVNKPDTTEILESIEHGKLKPSKSLQDSILSMLKGNKEFVLIDDQKVEFEQIRNAALNAVEKNQKTVYIVRGGPGTGKSVIAINLLAECINKGIMTQYITATTAPREVYSAMLQKGYKKSEIKALFSSSGTFYSREYNQLPIAIVDEAHRLKEKSGLFSKGNNQTKEIINASIFSVFFIDRNQRVTFKDAGTIESILKYANEQKALIYEGALESQFRCNGSDGYLSWLDNVLQITETANYDGFDGDYDFKVFDNPNDLFNAIVKKNKGSNKSRLLAGYCWNWPKEGRNSTLEKDIKIPEHNFYMSWNLGNSTTYAIDNTSINEVGCVHTTQGLEFEYVGVIIGDDLRYENGNLIVDLSKRASTDRSTWGINSLFKSNPTEAQKIAEELVKNTYRTLMTRGQKGCYIYCTDKNLANYFKLAYGHQLSYTYQKPEYYISHSQMVADAKNDNEENN